MKILHQHSAPLARALKKHFLAIAALTLCTQLNAEDCKNWDVNGRRAITQSDKNVVHIDLEQHLHARFSGTASFVAKGRQGSKNVLDNGMWGTIGGRFGTADTTHAGTVEGTLEGDRFRMKIKWDYGDTGVYTGVIAQDGMMSGTVYAEQDPSRKATWAIDRAVTCYDTKNKVGIGTPKKSGSAADVIAGGVGAVKDAGQMVDGNAFPAKPSTPKPSAKKPPFITGTPAVVYIPQGRTEGTATLAWDAGPDHPYAEVWVKEGDNDPKKLFESKGNGKGTLKVKVTAGTGSKAYSYILSDAGTDLGSVLVMGSR